MHIPPFLKKDDIIGIAATARKISELELSDAIQIIQQHGYQVQLAPNLYAQENQFAGSDAQRKVDLQSLINDPSVKAIIIARGGYGTMRIIDDIDFSALTKKPKWIIGYSDVTVLHSALHKLGIASLHATMPINFLKDSTATESLFKVLNGDKMTYNYDYSNYNTKNLFKLGEVNAPIVGGNLSLLYAMQGSTSDIDTDGKILFLEDLDEYLYHIDRMILSLKRAGKFKHLAGLIIGGMSDMRDNTVPFGHTVEEIIAHHIEGATYPVCYNFPCGHIDKNMALPLGVQATLSVTQNSVNLKY